MIFVQDRVSEGVIRQSLSDLNIGAAQFVNGGVSAATSDLANRPSPALLIVDIGKTSDPLVEIKQLANVCEPSTGVIVIGESNDISLYRELKEAGVVEYFYKPLVRNLFREACSAVLSGDPVKSPPRTGRLILTLGVRGGVGATTIATRSAWHLAMERERRVLLADLDVCMGDAALQLGAVPTKGLREVLENPGRMDELFLDRALIHATPRLDLLASLENLGGFTPFKEDAVLSLLAVLLRHYRYVFVDIPGAAAAQMTRVMQLPSLCLLVSDARLVSARDVGRWSTLIGPNTPDRATLHILNKAGAHGGLSEEQFAKAAGVAPDVVVPYGRDIEEAAMLGTESLAKCGGMTRALGPVFRELAGEAVEVERSLIGRLFG
ncbi:response regulator receiver protein [Marinicaulis flavus]|uniref:Response regulator receiver protein n=1 Tax=Hyphococcus luteus TaxID=2058213 RepID=A0A2S7K8E3_9PROT|nr:response regulator receiver protein [Marinicaulis flavus]